MSNRPTKLEALNQACQCAYAECPGAHHVIDDLRRRFNEYLEEALAAEKKKIEQAAFERGRQDRHKQVLKVGDEVNQCLQIIVTNAGNIKDRALAGFQIDRTAIAIEEAVDRAAKAIRSLAQPAASAPRCIGPWRGCDADLPGEPHALKCPLYNEAEWKAHEEAEKRLAEAYAESAKAYAGLGPGRSPGFVPASMPVTTKPTSSAVGEALVEGQNLQDAASSDEVVAIAQGDFDMPSAGSREGQPQPITDFNPDIREIAFDFVGDLGLPEHRSKEWLGERTERLIKRIVAVVNKYRVRPTESPLAGHSDLDAACAWLRHAHGEEPCPFNVPTEEEGAADEKCLAAAFAAQRAAAGGTGR